MDNTLIKKLPGELRNRVYAMVLVARGEEKTDVSDWKKDTSLLRVCKQIREEASDFYYESNNFYYLVSAGDGLNEKKWSTLSDWFSLIGQPNASKIKNLELDYDLSAALAVTVSNHPPARINRYQPWTRQRYQPWIEQHTLARFAPLVLDILLTLDELKAGGLTPAVVKGTSYPTFVGRVLSIIGQPSGPSAPYVLRLADTVGMWVDEEAALAEALASPDQDSKTVRPRQYSSLRPRLKGELEEWVRATAKARAQELAGMYA